MNVRPFEMERVIEGRRSVAETLPFIIEVNQPRVKNPSIIAGIFVLHKIATLGNARLFFDLERLSIVAGVSNRKTIKIYSSSNL